MRKKIRNILEAVQGNLFVDEFAKADQERELIENEISRLRSEVMRLEQEVEEIEKKPPCLKSNKTVNVRGKQVNVTELNERNRKNDIADRRLKIKSYKGKIVELEQLIKGKGESWQRINPKQHQ